MKPRKLFKRECACCKQIFRPTGRFAKLCEACKTNKYKEGIQRRRKPKSHPTYTGAQLRLLIK